MPLIPDSLSVSLLVVSCYPTSIVLRLVFHGFVYVLPVWSFIKPLFRYIVDLGPTFLFHRLTPRNIAGFVSRRIADRSTCMQCCHAVISSDDVHPFVAMKDRGGLMKPSPGIIAVCNTTERCFQLLLRRNNGKLPQGQGVTSSIDRDVLSVRICGIRAMCHGWACLYDLFIFWFCVLLRKFAAFLSRSAVWVFVFHARSYVMSSLFGSFRV